MISSLLNVAYLLPIPLRAFFAAPPADAGPEHVREAPASCLVAIGVTAAGSAALFFYPELPYEAARRLFRE